MCRCLSEESKGKLGKAKTKKDGQVETTLLYIRCRVGRCNGCVKFEI